VIVNDFDVVSLSFSPNKADSELVVDSYAVLALAIALERLQVIARED